MDLPVDERGAVHVARQPILQPSGRVFGYELLYRASADDQACAEALDLASARVLTDVMLNLGLETLTHNRLAFFNLSRGLLLAGAAALIPRNACVLELHEDLEPDSEMIAACEQLVASGYTLALDDFLPETPAEDLLPFVKYVKVDVLATTAEQRSAIARRLLPRGLKLIAEKVQTDAQAVEAREMGYSLAQGYFFCHPTTFGSGSLPPQRLAALHLMAALHDPDVTISEVDELIKRDVALSYRVLRSVNSAAFGGGREVGSIHDALVFLGIDQIRQWASVWALAGAHDRPSEAMTMTLLRARHCELIGRSVAGGEAGAAYFLLGLCSLLDVILDRPMPFVLEKLPLPASIRAALLGTPGPARSALDAVVAYEQGSWDAADAAATAAGIPAAILPEAYSDAVRWSHHLATHSAAA